MKQSDKAQKVIQTLPARLYHDPLVYEQERQSIFAGQWLLFGHESLVSAPGQYLAMTVAGWPIFVIRDKEGHLKGFHNVCRHRAAMIVRDGQGTAAALRCMYHGWVYDTDGQLRKAPDFGGDESDEKDLYDRTSLFPVHVRVWNSLVFICMAEGDPPPFEESLGDLTDVLADIDLADYKFYDTASHTLQCNWKTYVENYLEGYHIPTVHPELNKEVDFSTYRVSAANRIARHDVATQKDDAVNDGLWVWLWPHAALNIYKNGMNLELMMPAGPETMELRYCYLFKDISPAAEEDNRRTIDMSFSVTQEDIEICEIVQKNLRAGMYDRGELSPKHEGGVAYFQQLITECLP